MSWHLALHRGPLTPTPLPRGERGYSHEPINSVPSPLEGEGQGEGYVDAMLDVANKVHSR